MNRRWKRLLLMVLFAVVAIYGIAIFRAYQRPPLSVSVVASNKGVVGVDVDNEARWPITLTDAYVNGLPSAKVAAMASLAEPNATSVYLVSSVAVSPEDHPYKTGIVAGWVVPPTRPRRDLHGFRIELPLDTLPAGSVLVVSYRYLGWPFVMRSSL